MISIFHCRRCWWAYSRVHRMTPMVGLRLGLSQFPYSDYERPINLIGAVGHSPSSPHCDKYTTRRRQCVGLPYQKPFQMNRHVRAFRWSFRGSSCLVSAAKWLSYSKSGWTKQLVFGLPIAVMHCPHANMIWASRSIRRGDATNLNNLVALFVDNRGYREKLQV